MFGLRLRTGALGLAICLAALGLSLLPPTLAQDKDSGAKKTPSAKAQKEKAEKPAAKKETSKSKKDSDAKKKSAAPADASPTAPAGQTGVSPVPSIGGAPASVPAGTAAPVNAKATGSPATAGGVNAGGNGGSNGSGGSGVGGGVGKAGAAAAGAHQGPDPEVVKKVMAIQDLHTPKLLQQKGIVGTGTALDEKGNVIIDVYLSGADSPVIPKELDGVPVRAKTRGLVHPRWQLPPDRQTQLPRATPIGVSAFVQSSLCATGTLGCRLRDKKGTIYALSNNHVFALENLAPLGSPIFQPGPADSGCITSNSSQIAELFKFIPIQVGLTSNNVVDAAIAKTDEKLVNTTTLIDGYGVPRSNPARAFLGQKVQKYGRTTGYTRGEVVAVNATVLVLYTAGIAVFNKQIVIIGENGGFPAFSAAGDSGSLIVDLDRRPVALLFAGGGFPIDHTDANPIDDVLESFNIEGLAIDDSTASSIGKVGSSSN